MVLTIGMPLLIASLGAEDHRNDSSSERNPPTPPPPWCCHSHTDGAHVVQWWQVCAWAAQKVLATGWEGGSVVRRACCAWETEWVWMLGNLELDREKNRGSLRIAGCQLSSRFSEKPCHKGIRWKAIEQDTGHFGFHVQMPHTPACMCASVHSQRGEGLWVKSWSLYYEPWLSLLGLLFPQG